MFVFKGQLEYNCCTLLTVLFLSRYLQKVILSLSIWENMTVENAIK